MVYIRKIKGHPYIYHNLKIKGKVKCIYLGKASYMNLIMAKIKIKYYKIRGFP